LEEELPHDIVQIIESYSTAITAAGVASRFLPGVASIFSCAALIRCSWSMYASTNKNWESRSLTPECSHKHLE